MSASRQRLCIGVLLITSLLAALTCTSPSANVANRSVAPVVVVVNVPAIIGRTPKEVEAVTGKAKERTKITNEPDQMPGEFRDYEIKGAKLGLTLYGMMVRYYRKRAVHITIDMPEHVDTAEAVLKMAGIDVQGAQPRVVAPLATRWTGTFNGVDFKDVAAAKMGSDKSLFSTVQATLAP